MPKKTQKPFPTDGEDDDDDDDRTATTAELSRSTRSSSCSSWYSGCSFNSNINNVKSNNINSYSYNKDNNIHRRQRARSEDYVEEGAYATSSTGTRIVVPATSAAASSTPITLPHPPPSPFAGSCSFSSSSSTTLLNKQQHQQQSLPPSHTSRRLSPPPLLPSRRPFGSGGSNKRHTTYSLSSSRTRGNSDDYCDGGNDRPRRCRSEDFVDGSCSNVNKSIITKREDLSTSDKSDIGTTTIEPQESSTIVPASSGRLTDSFDYGDDNVSVVSSKSKSRSFSAAHHTNKNDGMVNEGEDQSFLYSPTSVMQDVHNYHYQQQQHQQQQDHEQQQRDQQQIHVKIIDEPSPAAAADSIKCTVNDGSASTNNNSNNNSCFDNRERILRDYRQTVRSLKQREKRYRKGNNGDNNGDNDDFERRRQQRRFQLAMQLAGTYHWMGLIHYQQCRYETARHVLQYGIDILIAHRASTIAVVPTAGAAVDEFDNDIDADCIFVPLPPLPTLDEVAPHLSYSALLLVAELVIAKGKIFAAQGLWDDVKRCSGQVLQWSAFQRQRCQQQQQQQQQQLPGYHHGYSHSTVAENNIRHASYAANNKKYWDDWGPITARAQVLFAQCFQRENRPDIAMRYYQEALAVQRYVLGPNHVQAAETMYLIGNLHTSRGLLGLAGQCYDEALRVYIFHRQHHTTTTAATSTTTTTTADDNQGIDENHSTDCIMADEATVLASLGWIFLLQRDYERAFQFTNQALHWTVHALGASHRNVASMQYQLACIQNHGH